MISNSLMHFQRNKFLDKKTKKYYKTKELVQIKNNIIAK